MLLVQTKDKSKFYPHLQLKMGCVTVSYNLYKSNHSWGTVLLKHNVYAKLNFLFNWIVICNFHSKFRLTIRLIFSFNLVPNGNLKLFTHYIVLVHVISISKLCSAWVYMAKYNKLWQVKNVGKYGCFKYKYITFIHRQQKTDLKFRLKTPKTKAKKCQIVWNPSVHHVLCTIL